MPPKQRITREMILERSFTMFCREGMEAVNARSVAKALNCSTQPIFSYFSGMDDLKNALDQKARDTFEQFLHTVQGDSLLKDYCIAYIRFAIEQPRLFAHMFLRIGEGQGSFAMNAMLRDPVVDAECAKTGLNHEQAHALCVEMWVFAHGLAAIQASGQAEFDMERVEQMVAHAYEAGVLRAQKHAGDPQES